MPVNWEIKPVKGFTDMTRCRMPGSFPPVGIPDSSMRIPPGILQKMPGAPASRPYRPPFFVRHPVLKPGIQHPISGISGSGYFD